MLPLSLPRAFFERRYFAAIALAVFVFLLLSPQHPYVVKAEREAIEALAALHPPYSAEALGKAPVEVRIDRAAERAFGDADAIPRTLVATLLETIADAKPRAIVVMTTHPRSCREPCESDPITTWFDDPSRPLVPTLFRARYALVDTGPIAARTPAHIELLRQSPDAEPSGAFEQSGAAPLLLTERGFLPVAFVDETGDGSFAPVATLPLRLAHATATAEDTLFGIALDDVLEDPCKGAIASCLVASARSLEQAIGASGLARPSGDLALPVEPSRFARFAFVRASALLASPADAVALAGSIVFITDGLQGARSGADAVAVLAASEALRQAPRLDCVPTSLEHLITALALIALVWSGWRFPDSDSFSIALVGGLVAFALFVVQPCLASAIARAGLALVIAGVAGKVVGWGKYLWGVASWMHARLGSDSAQR